MKNQIRAQVAALFGCTSHEVRIISISLDANGSLEWAYGQTRNGSRWIFENGNFKEI